MDFEVGIEREHAGVKVVQRTGANLAELVLYTLVQETLFRYYYITDHSQPSILI